MADYQGVAICHKKNLDVIPYLPHRWSKTQVMCQVNTLEGHYPTIVIGTYVQPERKKECLEETDNNVATVTREDRFSRLIVAGDFNYCQE